MEVGLFSVCVRVIFVLFCVCVICCYGEHTNRDINTASRQGIHNGSTDVAADGPFRDAYIFRKSLSQRYKRGTTTGLADISRFSSASAPGKQYIVYVDDTITRLIFQVAVARSNPVIIATTPSGMPSPVHPALNGTITTTVTATLDIPITGTDYGFWKFQKLDGSTWDVTIRCESPVHVTHQLYDKTTGAPVNDYPVIGVSYRLEATVTASSSIDSISLAFLNSRAKVSPIGMSPLISKGGGVYEAASVKMPSEVFMVTVQGKDKTGHLLKRMDPTEITPVSLKLDVPPYTGATVFEYKTFSITFTVTNIMSTEQDIDVRIEDDRGYAQAPKFLSATLKSGETFNGTFVLQASFAGLTTLASIKARQYLGGGQFSPGPTEFRNVTVIKNETTTTSTSTTASTSTTTTPTTSTSTTTPTTTSTTSTTTSTTTPSTTTSTTRATTKPTTTPSTSASSTAAVTTKLASSSAPASQPAASVQTTLSGSSYVSQKSTKPSTAVPNTSPAASNVVSSTQLSTKGGNTAAPSSQPSGSISNSSPTAVTQAANTGTTKTNPPGKVTNAPAVVQSTTAPLTSTPSPLVSAGTSSTTRTASAGTATSNSRSGSSNTGGGSNNSGSGSNNSDDDDSTSLEISAGVVVASMVTGTIVGIAAIATMAVVFNKALNKKDKRVGPEDRKQKRPITPSWT